MNATASRFMFGDLVRFRGGTVTWEVRQVWQHGSYGDTFHARLISTASGREASDVPTNALILVQAA